MIQNIYICPISMHSFTLYIILKETQTAGYDVSNGNESLFC